MPFPTQSRPRRWTPRRLRRPPCPPPSPVFPAGNWVQQHNPRLPAPGLTPVGAPPVCALPSTSSCPPAVIRVPGEHGIGEAGMFATCSLIGKIVKARLCMCGDVTLALTGGQLPAVFSGKHKANLPGGSTSLSGAASANVHGHVLKPCSSRSKTQQIASRGEIDISLSLIIRRRRTCPRGETQPSPGPLW